MPAATASPRKAAAWMAGWLTAMVVMAVAGRVATRELHVFQIMEMRSVLGFALLWPLLHASGGLAAIRTDRIGRHIARNAVHYGAQFGWFFALTLIPIAQVVAIEFTMPIWTALLAVAFLGERLGAARIVAVALGLIGVAVIVRPGIDHVDPGQLIALAAAVGFAISIILVKSLTSTESVVAIIFWMLVVQSAIGLVPALVVWRTPTAAVWPWIGVIALCGTYSHFCMAKALTLADAMMIVPIDFLRVPLSAIAGWLVYNERIDLFTVVGAGLILGANLLNLRRTIPAPQDDTRMATSR
jgi:drug/metabolite transporter (DMT)-like permease